MNWFYRRLVMNPVHFVFFTMLFLSLLVSSPTEFAHAAGEEIKPYDEKLLRLSEILGAVHFLRELCGADEGQRWRDQMAGLVAADGGSGLRKLRLTNSFNKGYRSYRRTYQTCNPSAQSQLTRFLGEGADLAKALGDFKP